jgi:tetratricopeptide (TPR) repeat protein
VPGEPPRKAKAAPKRPPVTATAAEQQKPASLKRLLADARRLRARGKPAAALKAYGQAVEIEARNADALAGRGLCYLDLSQYSPAEASFHAALEADALHAEALMGLAETYRYEGRRTEAVTYYQRYLAAHPDGEDAFAARGAIDALKE